jgi:hypothetical protein
VRDGLRCLQLSGSIFLHAQFTAPWAYQSADTASLEATIQSNGRRVIVFHIFTEGSSIVALPSGHRIDDVAPGDIVILPFADPHVCGHPTIANPIDIRRLWPPKPWPPIAMIRHGAGRSAHVDGLRLSLERRRSAQPGARFAPAAHSRPSTRRVPWPTGWRPA